MARRHSTLQTGTRLTALLLLAACVGCGSSEYNRLATARYSALRGEAKFRSLFGPTKLADTPFSIRVPQIFKNSYLEDSQYKDDGGTIHPERFQPPFLQIPGMKVCYEGSAIDPEAGKVPYYCYLAAIPAKPGDAEKLAGELQAKLAETFKDAPTEWQGVDAESPTGNPVQWEKLRITGPQKFRYKAPRGVIEKDFEGIFELWICEQQDYVVLVGWRSPKAVEGISGEAPAEPVDILRQGPTGDLKIDLTSMPALTAGTLTRDDGATTEKG